MKLPYCKLYIEIRLDGKVVRRKRLSRSFVKAFTQIVYAAFGNASFTVTDTSGTGHSETATSGALRADGASASTSKGIVVGTGTTTVAIGDTKLATLIANGSSSGQLSYGAQTTNTPNVSASPATFTMVRTMTNNSGGDITVNETGIYGLSNAPGTYCLIRDIVSPGVLVQNGHSITVTYTWSAAI